MKRKAWQGLTAALFELKKVFWGGAAIGTFPIPI